MVAVKRPKKQTDEADLSEKELVFKGLTKILETAGYVVRREALKRGHGWRVMSGSCNTQGEQLVFVDRRLPKEDQIEFLAFKIRALGVVPEPTVLAALPKKLGKLLSTAPSS